jgi:hypothetical protein
MAEVPFFNQMINAMVANDSEMHRLDRMGGMLLENGFRGPLVPEIERMRAAGRIRAMEVPMLSGNRFEPVTRKSTYHARMFALKVEDKTFQTRTLLVFPHETEPTVQIIEVGPQTSITGDRLDIAAANRRLKEEFHALTAPSKTSYIIKDWMLEPGETPYESFSKNPGKILPVNIVNRIPGENMELYESVVGPYRRAVANDALDVSEGNLRTLFSADDVTDIERTFDQLFPPETPGPDGNT